MTFNEKLLEKVAQAAIDSDLADAVFTRIKTPIGRLILVQSDKGICRIAFNDEMIDEVLEEVSLALGPRVVSSKEETRVVSDALLAYLEGEPLDLDMPVDLSLVHSPFRRKVLEKLEKVPRGKVVTYGGLARRAGNPRAARATGTACATNPVPLVVPCHRVVPSGGGVGSYGGGPELKEWLLKMEGAIQ